MNLAISLALLQVFFICSLPWRLDYQGKGFLHNHAQMFEYTFAWCCLSHQEKFILFSHAFRLFVVSEMLLIGFYCDLFGHFIAGFITLSVVFKLLFLVGFFVF